jgi:hypothetical protein
VRGASNEADKSGKVEKTDRLGRDLAKTQPDVRIILMPVKVPGTSPKATAALRAAVESGALGGGVLDRGTFSR